MIKYNPKIWFKHIISFNHSDTINKLWKELIALGIFTLDCLYRNQIHWKYRKAFRADAGVFFDWFCFISFIGF